MAEKLLTTAAFSSGATHQALHREAPEVDATSVEAWSHDTSMAQHQCQFTSAAPWGQTLRAQLDALHSQQDAFPNPVLVQRAANFVRAQL